MASSSAVPSSVSAAAAVAVAAAVLLLAAVGAEAETRKYQFDVSLFGPAHAHRSFSCVNNL